MPSFSRSSCGIYFFFNDTATTEIYTLSLHDALPISCLANLEASPWRHRIRPALRLPNRRRRSEEHTSELQSHVNLVCRLLLEKKNKTKKIKPPIKQKKDNQQH